MRKYEIQKMAFFCYWLTQVVPDKQLLNGCCVIIIISMSLSINIASNKHSWNLAVVYPIGQSVCVSVCLESVLWQNGCLDPDAVWDGE